MELYLLNNMQLELEPPLQQEEMQELELRLVRLHIILQKIGYKYLLPIVNGKVYQRLKILDIIQI